MALTKDRGRGKRLLTQNTQSNPDGFTTLTKTDTDADHVLYATEDAISFLYYAVLKNDRGTGTVEEDLQTSLGFLEQATENLRRYLKR